jgi:hypothetical protein
MGRNVLRVIATLMNSLSDSCSPTDTGRLATDGHDRVWKLVTPVGQPF